MVAADAPARFRYSPSTLRAPSWVMSENRLTMPIRVMNAMAPETSARFFVFMEIASFRKMLQSLAQLVGLFHHIGMVHCVLRVADFFTGYQSTQLGLGEAVHPALQSIVGHFKSCVPAVGQPWRSCKPPGRRSPKNTGDSCGPAGPSSDRTSRSNRWA